jgi:hypothetical protein
MTLLQEIKKDAQNSRVDISDLLRKCMELAFYLKNEELKSWVNYELEGYPNKEKIPKYRIFGVTSYGDFQDSFGGIGKNYPIPTSPLREPFLDFATKHYFGGSISSLVELANNKEGYIRILWPPEVCQTAGNQVYEYLRCLHAWKLIPNSAIIAIIDSVRTKILRFALEIEGEDPNIGENPGEAPHIDKDHVTLMVESIIMANSIENLAQGGSKMGDGATYKIGSQKAGRDINQTGRDQYQAVGDIKISTESSATDVLKVVKAMKDIIDRSDIEAKNKKKIDNHLDNAIIELEDKNPDKGSIAGSMKQANEILEEAKTAGKTLESIGGLVGKVITWLGPIAHSVGLI